MHWPKFHQNRCKREEKNPKLTLMPFDGVAVVAGELVMEVMISFAKSDKGSDDVIAGRVTVVKWLVSEPMSKRVDTEGCLLHKENPEDAGVDKSTNPITPAQSSNEARKDETHEDHNSKIVLVLPDNNGVLVQVRNIGTSNTLRVLLKNHPSHMGVQQSLADTIGILVGIGVTVMSPMITRPPTNGTLNSTTTNSCKENLQRKARRV